MLTSKGKYGPKALIHLARQPNGETTQIADIAAKNNISKKYLDAILLDLRHAGFVRSRKGPGGGYSPARPASEIFVGAVVRLSMVRSPQSLAPAAPPLNPAPIATTTNCAPSV